MSIISGGGAVVGAGGVAGAYQISRSLRFNSADSAYLNRTFGSGGSRTTWTLSGWVKRSVLGTNQAIFSCGSFSTNLFQIYFEDNNNQLLVSNFPNSATPDVNLKTTALYRDVSAWYHIVVAMDTTQATSSNRVKLYVNGLQVTALDTATYPSQNATPNWNTNALAHQIGARSAGVLHYDGYMTEINFVDGQALTPTDFGEFNTDTGVWQPIKYTGTYGTNGFYLNFSDNASTTTLGDDLSGNGNDWTTNNFSVTAGAGNDSLVDSPTRYGTDTGAGGEVRGNYCTFNPLFKLGGTAANTWARNGNLEAKTDTAASLVIFGTMGMQPSTKFYAEFTMVDVAEPNDHVGIVTNIQADADSGTCVAYKADGNKIVNGSQSAYGATYTDGDVIGIAVNLVDNEVTFYKNGSSQGTITGVTVGTYFHRVRFNNVAGVDGDVTANWGQRAFTHAAPSGFKALVTTNLPTPTIEDGGEYFDTVLYTGNGSTQSITGVGFQPDFVWLKARSSAFGHGLFDVIRGTTKRLSSDGTGAEGTESGVTSFDSNGFSIGSATFGNNSGTTMVGWNWKANGAGVSNTAGTITSTVSANTTSGFSIVRFTGTDAIATVGHGLGAVPKFMILKGIERSDWWGVYHVSLGNTKYLQLNTTSAELTSSTVWNDTTPTSTVFTVADQSAINPNGELSIAYVFAEVPGYSAFGSYTGNGSADGPFVYTGFRPRWLLTKRTDSSSSGDWNLVDTARGTYNVVGPYVYANQSTAEGNAAIYDILSNGFKIRESGAGTNANGSSYIYAAFSEVAFNYALGR
jgi:hypothetical protein